MRELDQAERTLSSSILRDFEKMIVFSVKQPFL